MTSYDHVRAMLTHLETAKLDVPKVSLTYHDVTDETATAVLDALDTFRWCTEHAGGTHVWLRGSQESVEVVLHLRTPTPTIHPNVERARALLAKVLPRG